MDIANKAGTDLSSKNRRSAARKRPRGWLKVDCRKCGTCGPSIADVVWDISQTGLCIVAHSPVVVGDELELQISSTSLNQSIKTQGKIIWVDPLDNNKFSMGVRFHDPLPYPTISQLSH